MWSHIPKRQQNCQVHQIFHLFCPQDSRRIFIWYSFSTLFCRIYQSCSLIIRLCWNNVQLFGRMSGLLPVWNWFHEHWQRTGKFIAFLLSSISIADFIKNLHQGWGSIISKLIWILCRLGTARSQDTKHFFYSSSSRHYFTFQWRYERFLN